MNRIAIIGMAGRFPGARTVDQFWQILRDGVCAVERLSTQELRKNGVPVALLEDPRYVRSAATLEGYDAFDNERFGYSPREARLLDPQHRVFLETCLTALEDAGIAPHRRELRVGVFGAAGSNVQSYALAHALQGETASLTHVSTDKDFLATRVSFELGCIGPSMSVQTSTSSSLVAVHLACRSLLDDECDVAIAGGISIRIPHRVGYLFEEGGVLSADGVCRPLSSEANGTIFSSGVGVVVLKRLDAALADRDRVRAVVLGSAIGHDGGAKESYVISSAEGVARIGQQALARAGVGPETIGLVEAHATGTVVGDPIELAGLATAYERRREAGLAGIGSVKGNIGHLEAAAGVASLIKAVLALEHQRKPKTVGAESPNSALLTERSPFYVLQQTEPWDAAGPRRAAVSSLGLGGTNAAVILEEAPPLPHANPPVERPLHLLTLSAPSEASLGRQARHVAAELKKQPTASLGDLCYTANTGRSLSKFRVAVAASSARAMAETLESGPPWSTEGDASTPAVVWGASSERPPVVAFLFSGQGQQRLGMTRELFETLPSFRKSMLACDAAMRKCVGRSVTEILYGSDDSTFQRPLNLQPIFFSTQYALAKMLLDWGITPSAAMGHSLGEYAAACTAGAFSLEEAIGLLATRGALVERGNPAMAAVFAPAERVRAAVAPYAATVAVAVENGAEEWVVSGESSDVEAILRRFESEGVRVRRFDIGFAAHSPLLNPILDDLEAAAEKVDYSRTLRFPIVSTLTGRVAREHDLRSARYWRDHTREMVRSVGAIHALYELGTDVFIEIGPNPSILTGAISVAAERGAKSVIGLPLLSRKSSDWRRIQQTLGALHVRGVAIDWNAFDRDFSRRTVSFPTYAFRHETFNFGDQQDNKSRTSVRPPTSESPSKLGRRIHSPALRERVFERQIDQGGMAIFDLPLASLRFFLELALEGATAMSFGRTTVLSDVSFLEPLIVHSGNPRLVQTVVRPNAPRPTLEIFSAMSGEEDWTLHCKATFGVDEPTRRPTKVDVATMKGAPHARRRDGDAVYRALDTSGFRVPENERVLARMWHTPLNAVVELTRPSASAGAALEAAAHGLLAMLDWEEDRTWLPLGFQSLRSHEAGTGASVATIELREIPGDGGMVTADIEVLDVNGRTLASLAGYCLRSIDRAALVAQGTELMEWSHEVAWEVEDSGKTDAGAPTLSLEEARWIILGDDAFATAVAAGVHQAGGSVLLVDDVAKLSAEALRDTNGILNLLPTALSPDEPLATSLERACKSTIDVVALLGRTSWLTAAAGPAVFVVTRGGRPVLGALMDPLQALAWGMASTLRAEHPNLRCVNVDLDPHANDGGLAMLLGVLSTEVKESQLAFRHDRRHVARLVRSAPSRRQLAVPAEGFRATLRMAGQVENVVLTPAAVEEPGPHQVAIAAQAHGLSFRDVLTVLGVPGAHGTIGFESAGIVTAVGAGVSKFAVGDSVMALSPTHLGSQVIVDERLVAMIPPTLSFEQAATIPLAFVIAWHLVHDVAEVKAGQCVLVHAASGAVGQAIVQVAAAAGARVLATASITKQRALRALDIERVFSSRTQAYGAEVLEHTGGAGIDVVFHSLQPRFLSTSAQCLKPDGLLVDFSVQSLADSDAPAFVQRYVRFDLSEALSKIPGRLGETLQQVADAIAAGTIRLIESKTFAIHDLLTAFRRLASPKHSGKVVVASEVEPLSSINPRGEALDPRGTYLVAGGSTREREAVALQLRNAGAGRVILAGVRAESSEAPASANEIAIEMADVDRMTVALTAALRNHSQIQGVFLVQDFDSAATIDVGGWRAFSEKFVEVASFARAVDQASRELRLSLDFFCFFSSVAAIIGIPGAAFESVLASYLDGLAYSRRASGLPATAINWAIPSVGMAENGASHWARGQSDVLGPSRSFGIMASTLNDPPAQVAILPIRWEGVARKEPSLRGDPFFSRLFMESADPRRRSDAGRVAAELRESPASERLPRLTEFVESTVVRALGLRASQRLDPQLGFRELGLDSLLAVELRNELQEALELRLPQGITFNHPNVTSLSEFLATKLFRSESPSNMPVFMKPLAEIPVISATSREEDDLDSLSADELEKLLKAELGADD